ncbi:hypothetical protein AAE478_002808 [Parahypoxylon ruwenzoriense]
MAAAVLGAPTNIVPKSNGDDNAATTRQDALAKAFGLDADTIAELTKTFPNEPNAADCASDNLSFGQQRQCINAGLLDDPSF